MEYNITMKMDPDTRIYGITGFPLAHSLSPVVHNTAFRVCDINAIYLFFETQDIRSIIRGMKTLGIKGMSITLPHKVSVISHLDEIDSTASKIGAVNTIVNREGTLMGYNTDATGGIRCLEKRMSLKGKRCIIVGAGGTARALGFALMQKDLDLYIVNRTYDKGISLSKKLGATFLMPKEIPFIRPDILIQTTPVGMYPNCSVSPVPPEILTEGMVVMDIIYNPLETRLLKEAKKRGCITISGIEMFINQAADQFELWTGIRAPLLEMKKSAIHFLQKHHEKG
jgi:shikimate dehydrogenase